MFQIGRRKKERKKRPKPRLPQDRKKHQMHIDRTYRANLRSGRGHLAEETRAGALLRRSLLALLRVSGSRVRLLLLARGRRPGRGCGRPGGSAARGSRGGTTALTRHFEDDVEELDVECTKFREEDERRYVNRHYWEGTEEARSLVSRNKLCGL